MKDWIETLSHKNIFIMTIGRLQQDFEYLFSDIRICGYVDEGVLESSYMGKPVRKTEEILKIKEVFLIVCEEKKEEKILWVENLGFQYKVNFCFSEDLFSVFDYELKSAAAGREIVICDGEDSILYHKPDILLDSYKHGEKLHGMEMLDPVAIKEWSDYFIIITVEKPEGIISSLQGMGLTAGEDYVWYLDVKNDVPSRNRKIAYYGCGCMAETILSRLEMGITKSITVEELKKCDKKEQYVVISGSVFDKLPVLESSGYTEIEDFVHWNYIERMKGQKPSELLREVMMSPVVEQPYCSFPFEFAYITTAGEVFGCICPDWTRWGFGNIKYESCERVWNSVYARIFRLSIINRTFCFCKEKYCYYCNPTRQQAKEKESRFYGVNSMYPKVVKPCIDYSCNLFCESCRRGLCVVEGRERKEAEFVAERLLDGNWMEQAEILNIAGMGEVFFSGIYRRLLYETRRKRKAVQIFSNGNLFGREEFENLLKCYELIEVEISVDAARKETYEKLRRGGNWDILMKNLTYLGGERERGRLHSLTINMIVQRDNYQEIPEFIKLGKEIHADVIAIRPLMNWGTYSGKQYREISMISHEDEYISDELKAILQNPLLREKEVDYSWFQKRL